MKHSVLVATDFPPDAPGGGPAVLRQMLAGLPANLHWWSVRCPQAEVSASHFLLSSQTCFPAGKLLPMRKWTHHKAWLMEHLWAAGAARSLQRTINRVQPDLIWVIPHDWSIFPLHRVLITQCEIPNTKCEIPKFHVTIQDYPDAHDHGRIWGHARVTRMARMQEELYAKASSRDATSLPMLEDLEKRTGKAGIQMLHQGLEAEDFVFLKNPESRIPPKSPPLPPQESGSEIEDPAEGPSSASTGIGTRNRRSRQRAILSPNRNRDPKRIRIAYAGTILVEKEFALFCEMLEQVRNWQPAIQNTGPKILPKGHPFSQQESGLGTSNEGFDIHLELWGAHSYAKRPWFRQVWMTEHGNLSEDTLLDELRSCDWGYIPMALEDFDPGYNRYSFPTKFITYLAAGLPIITMGHPESSVMKMACSYDVGLRISSADQPLADLKGALQDLDAKKKYRPEILRCAQDHFDATHMRAQLRENLLA